MPFRPLLCAAPLLLLPACGEEAPPRHAESDPAMVAALHAPLMTDPDLVSLNDAASAVLLPGLDGSIPVEDASPAEIAAARAEAVALVGGPGRMKAAPAPGRAERNPAPDARVADALGRDRAHCYETATYAAAWAARMPEAFPVYPRAAVQEAVGSDAGRCALRAVSFATPVPPTEVIDFYFTRADNAGFSVRHEAGGGESTLGGTKGSQRFTLSVRRRADGMTAADLVTVGG